MTLWDGEAVEMVWEMCGVGGGLRGWLFRLDFENFNIGASFLCVLYFQNGM